MTTVPTSPNDRSLPVAATAVDAARPLVLRLGRTIVPVLAGSLVIAASARIATPIPFSPVPVTAQTLAVLLVAGVLGRRLGVAAVVAYLLEGAAGLPVFAGGAGPAVLAGVSGGYLLGFVAAAWLAGTLVERGWGRDVFRASAVMALGTAIILLAGAGWLAAGLGLGVETAFMAGVLPFLPGAVVKIGLGAAILPQLGGFAGRRRSGPAA